MLKLADSDRQELLRKPESGMGYQFVQVTLPDYKTKPGIAYNAELVLLEEEPRILLKSDYKSLLRTAESAVGKIKAIQFDPRPRPTVTSLKAASEKRVAPAKEAPKEKTKADEVFKRFSAYENDNRVTADRSLLPGTYATTEEDAKNVKTGKDAVARYALPNPTPASYRFTIRPDRDTVIQRGIVEPANGQPGGGVEVFFTDGTQPKTVSLPPDHIPDE